MKPIKVNFDHYAASFDLHYMVTAIVTPPQRGTLQDGLQSEPDTPAEAEILSCIFEGEALDLGSLSQGFISQLQSAAIEAANEQA